MSAVSLQSVVSRGYICPACKHKYAALEVTSLLDPRTGRLICEQCDEHPEVQEYDPNADPANGEANEDQMLKFNNATRDIQDALKLLEPVTIPSLNMDAWLALNVRSAAVLGEDGQPVEDVKNVKVKIGDEGDEKERIEKARLAEAQRSVDFLRGGEIEMFSTDGRIQNALPEWVTHSTVTGGATALGLDAQRRVESRTAAAMGRDGANGANGDGDEHDYYGNIDGSDEEEDEDMDEAKPAVPAQGQNDVKVEEDKDDGDGYTDDGYTPAPSAPDTPAAPAANGTGAVMVMGESRL
jgi:transcription initiation factor TFIIE subunit alpha